MPIINIQDATAKNAETLGHIGVATFVETYSDTIPGPAMMAHCTHEHSAARYAAYLDDERSCAWISEHSETGAPVGYALNCVPDLPVQLLDGDIELKRIYVLSKYHGHEIGAALLRAAESHARSLNAPRLLLGTYEGNDRATAFYKKHGFETIGTRKFDVGGKVFDDIVMAKRF